ncbi:MAG: hypothetical protein HQL48_09155 [Gammaproteobacteria bacterium]|nr:hypothetical protein [Gammaproteobacteria bacterium]
MRYYFLLLLLFITPLLALEPETFVDSAFIEQLKSSSSYRIAILPIDNYSVSPESAYHFRQRVRLQLQSRGYTLLALDYIDQQLYGLGVEHAGQLQLVDAEVLTKTVVADGYLFGVVEQSDVQHGGLYNAYAYSGSLMLQDNTGKQLWSALQGRVAKRRWALDPLNAVIDAIAINEGGEETEALAAVADNLLQTFPEGPVRRTDELLLDSATEIEVSH